MHCTQLRFLGCALVAASSQGACLVRDVPEDIYVDQVSYSVPASADGGGVEPDAANPPSAPPPTQSTPEGGAVASDVDAGTEPSAPPSNEPPNAACDLSGRWLVSERRVAVGLGVQQAGIWWLYLDLAQNGDQLTVTKGLVCGTAVQPIGALSASVEMEGCWPTLMNENRLDGLTGSVTSSGGSCDLQMSRYYAVFGATPAHYRDPSVAMPTLEEEASGGMPGWEDCDQDGRPGATLNVGGIVNGWRAEAIRSWGQFSGALQGDVNAFQVSLNWGQDESVMAVSSEALKATGAKDGNASLHFAQFARLGDGQANATDDAAICEQIRSLAPQLTPEANQ